jgi:hypothetical protein
MRSEALKKAVQREVAFQAAEEKEWERIGKEGRHNVTQLGLIAFGKWFDLKGDSGGDQAEKNRLESLVLVRMHGSNEEKKRMLVMWVEAEVHDMQEQMVRDATEGTMQGGVTE